MSKEDKTRLSKIAYTARERNYDELVAVIKRVCEHAFEFGEFSCLLIFHPKQLSRIGKIQDFIDYTEELLELSIKEVRHGQLFIQVVPEEFESGEDVNQAPEYFIEYDQPNSSFIVSAKDIKPTFSE